MMQIRTAMLLAAGRGERMRPLTDSMPKPLAPVAGRPLIAYAVERLAAAGVERVVINLAWRGDQIRRALGDSAYGTRLLYSDEGEHALETGGGIVKALPLLGAEPFWVVSADVWNDFPFRERSGALAAGDLAHLVMAPNPAFHPKGDFYLSHGRVSERFEAGAERLTYANIGLFRPELFAARAVEKRALAPWLREAMAEQRVSGERFDGQWWNVGTLTQLQSLDAFVRSKA